MKSVSAGSPGLPDSDRELMAALEAVLFAGAAPLSSDELCLALGVGPTELGRALSLLEEHLRRMERGICLLEIAGGFQLGTKPIYDKIIERLGKIPKQAGLSQAALETLAIVGYRQPVSKIDIEALRGVRSDSALNSLMERGLIQELGRQDAPGRPILYGTTPDFLMRFGLRDIGDLPPLPEIPEDDETGREAAAAKGDR